MFFVYLQKPKNMCLKINSIFSSQKAKSNITCYKVLLKNKITGNYVTPYMREVVPSQCINGEYPYMASVDPCDLDGIDIIVRAFNTAISTEITSGYIHTYADYNDAKYMAYYVALEQKRFKGEQDWIGCVCECQIPKGTKYYKGFQDNGVRHGYASKQIKIVNVQEVKRF